MTEADQRLIAALRALRPAAQDPAFRLAVLERRAKRRFHGHIAGLVCGSLMVLGLAVVATDPLSLGVWASEGALQAALALGSLTLAGWSLMRMRRPI